MARWLVAVATIIAVRISNRGDRHTSDAECVMGATTGVERR
jgi:hypothetical protein